MAVSGWADNDRREHLRSAILKLKPMGFSSDVKLYRHEADALFDEFCRLANFATLLGEPSPAEMAGLDEHGHNVPFVPVRAALQGTDEEQG